ncbi:molybdopterin molybdotransferase MoeA [Sulfuricystis thermophila]|uniref:molybdopterin molybdotransferase MoeA n=1 Tax=Sulfuricystis thermophila TaxID=2496847 RepID=UPI001036837C|nr:gephyrin-like molybdotransferase Glp [Sulfuricystis thermophila]
MLSYEQALEHLLAAATPVTEIRRLPLAAVRGRFLAEPLISTVMVPPLDNSAMDGYAVRCADVPQAGVILPVSQRIPAGSVGAPLQPGTAARIFTGAPIPPGADAVVMQEFSEHVPDGKVIINQAPKAGQNIRRAGEDIAAGSEILPAGARLGPAEIGLAASVGVAELPVRRRLRVALLSTGDELTEPGQPLPAGGIYNSNRHFLRALFETFGCAVTDAGHVPDTLEATRAALREAAAAHDLIVTSGGVSVGEEDHVKPAVEAEGALSLWKIAIKPGKPLAFGHVRKVGAEGTAESTAFIGLPGNPVSCFVTFLLFLRPYLLKRMGAAVVVPVARELVSASAWTKPEDRRSFLRARIAADGRVELYPNQSSGVLTSCVWADGLVDTPAQQTFAPGDTVRFLAFSDLL